MSTVSDEAVQELRQAMAGTVVVAGESRYDEYRSLFNAMIERKYGLACDSLRAAELVLADGERVRASDSENADLLWALRGGGGNFGVVTSLEFGLHAFGPEIYFA